MGFTKNYYKFVSQGMAALPGESIPDAWKIQAINGKTSVMYGGIYGTSMNGGSIYAISLGAGYNPRVMLGTGTNAFSIDDHTLQTDVSSSFTKASLGVTAGSLTEKLGRTLTWVGKYVYNGTEDITISEIGFTKNMYLQNAGGYTDVLIFREVFDTPNRITVSEGQGITVTLTFTFDGFNVLTNAEVMAE